MSTRAQETETLLEQEAQVPVITLLNMEVVQITQRTQVSGGLAPRGGGGTMKEELKNLIQALPTKADIEAQITRVEDAHRKDLQLLQTLTERLIVDEMVTNRLEQPISQVERAGASQTNDAAALQVQLDGLEDHGRRNNLRLQGLPETTDRENLWDTVMLIFKRMLTGKVPPYMEMDRLHRVLEPRPPDSSNPRDVICHMHYYSHRDTILRKAWEAGTIDFEAAQLKILPDLSRSTLQRRAMLRPILERVRQLGYTYHWGFPVSVLMRKDSTVFYLCMPADLPNLVFS